MAGDFSFVESDVPLVTNWNGYVRDQLIIICTSSTHPATAVTGQRIYETDTGNEYHWDGSAWALHNTLALTSAWTPFTPTWYDLTSMVTGSGGPTIGNGTLTGHYRKVGKTYEMAVYFGAGSTTTFGSSAWAFAGPLLGTPRFLDVELQLAFKGTGPLLYDVAPHRPGQGLLTGIGWWDIDCLEIGGLVDNGSGPRYYYDRTALPSPMVAGKTNGFFLVPMTAISSSSIGLTYVTNTSPFTWANGHQLWFQAKVEML